MVHKAVEATAPCRLELIGGRIDEAGSDGVVRLAIALDRRVWCRVEPSEGGVEIHSRDTGERIGADEALVTAVGPASRVARLLAAAGVRSGVRVVTQLRVPEDAGLGTGGALEVALSAALGRGGAEILATTREGDPPFEDDLAESDRHAAVFGGAHVLRRRSGRWSVERLAADPARLEECLLLVDPGPGAPPSFAAPRAPADSAAGGGRAVEALRAGAHHDVAAILTEVHRGCFDRASDAVSGLARTIGGMGGAAWPCGRLIAVWAAPGARSPGPKEAVSVALKEAGVRSFAARVDLRGLEVE